jgi:hypothetical protein
MRTRDILAIATLALFIFNGLPGNTAPIVGGKPKGEEPPAPKCAACPSCDCCRCKCLDLSGIWHVAGETEDGPYAGACVVTRVGNRYVFCWAMVDAPTIGVGLVKGNLIAVTWHQPGRSAKGLTLYEVSKDGKTMTGEWLQVPSDTQRRTETLRFLRKTADDRVSKERPCES